MRFTTPNLGTRFPAWYRRQSRIGRISLVLTTIVVAMALLSRASHTAELAFIFPMILCIIVVSPLLLILLYRWVTNRLLWKVRNRLIVTYALMSLAPVVLCLTLFAIAAYIFGGQFATNSALTQLDQASAEVSAETVSATLVSLASKGRILEAQPASGPRMVLPISLAAVKSGTFHPMSETAPDAAPNPFVGEPVPTWLFSGFRGLVLFKGQLYLVAYTKLSQGGSTATVLGSQHFNARSVANIGENLGRVILLPGFAGRNAGRHNGVSIKDGNDDININIGDSKDKDGAEVTIPSPPKPPDAPDAGNGHFATLDSGPLPPRTHFFDPPVVFSAPTSVLAWEDGRDIRGIVTVFSRPSILYTRLFASTNGLGMVVRIILLVIAIFFALLELFALLMAAGLSRTITRSVADLYHGTREIDAGNLQHRIVIKRNDQLGALATSFNGMTASIVDLLAQQREKERLLSELSIAREVQANLFPHSPVALPGFEIHAVCQPARTVSGDYFDFIFGRHGNDLYLALGDISGKGISAALLMASLHSAVRAFGLSSANGASAEVSRPSPAKLLGLLNKHIFGSTPPEKYATLFLAYYDSASRKLTYSNGGHLAPMILSTDGTVKHLDCGGPPVGLFNGLDYCEDSIELTSGDLLMAFSDGLTEPEQNEEQFGEERLFAYIREHHAEPLPALATNTLQRLQEWIGNHEQPDDMTLLLARQL